METLKKEVNCFEFFFLTFCYMSEYKHFSDWQHKEKTLRLSLKSKKKKEAPYRPKKKKRWKKHGCLPPLLPANTIPNPLNFGGRNQKKSGLCNFSNILKKNKTTKIGISINKLFIGQILLQNWVMDRKQSSLKAKNSTMIQTRSIF